MIVGWYRKKVVEEYNFVVLDSYKRCYIKYFRWYRGEVAKEYNFVILGIYKVLEIGYFGYYRYKVAGYKQNKDEVKVE